jgi:hypothetical protein
MISMNGDVRGRLALPHLVDPRRAAAEERDGCTVAAMSVTAADAVTAVVIRAALEEHRASGSSVAAEFLAPTDPDVDQLLDNLLGNPPDCTPTRSGPAPARDRLALVPSVVIKDLDDVELLVLATKAIAPYLGLDVKEARFAAAAAQVLTENGLAHAPESSCGVITAAGIDPQTRELTLAALDLGPVPGAGNPGGDTVVREAIERSRKNFGGLTSFLDRAQRAGVPVSMFLATGTQEATWRQRWRYSVRENVPGWCSVITLLRT